MRFALRTLVLAVLCGLPAASQPLRQMEVDLDAPDGGLHLSVTPCRYSDYFHKAVPDLLGTVSSKTEIHWSWVDIQIAFAVEDHERVSVFHVGPHTTAFSWRAMAVEDHLLSVGHDFDCATVPVMFKFVRSHSEGDDIRLREEIRRSEEERRAQLESQEKAELTRLSRLPSLESPTRPAFLSDDKRCVQQFQESLAMGGIERGKRIEELLKYCGRTVPNGTRVSVLGRSDQGYCRISIEEGEERYSIGWVPCSWVKLVAKASR